MSSLDTVLDSAVWILCGIILLFSIVGLRQRSKKILAAGLVLATVGFVVQYWLRARATEKAEQERAETIRQIEMAGRKMDQRLSELTRESMHGQVSASAAADLRQIQADLGRMRADATRLNDRVRIAEIGNLQLRATLLEKEVHQTGR